MSLPSSSPQLQQEQQEHSAIPEEIASKLPPATPPAVRNFTGTWKVHKKISDRIELLYKRMNIGWLARKIVNAVDISMRIIHTPIRVEIQESSKLGSVDVTFHLDGQWHPTKIADGRRADVRGSELDGGLKLRLETRYPDGSVLVDTRVLHTRIIMIQHLDYYYPSEGPVHSCCRVHVRVEAPRERQIALEIERRKASQAAAMRSLQASSVSTSSRSNPEAGPVQGPRRDPLQSTSRAEPATEEVQDTEAAGVQASAPHGSIKGIRAASESASSNEPGPESEQAADATTPREGASDLGGVDKDVPRLTGRWTVDETRSDPLEPFLKEIGVPWLLRKPICGLKVTTTFEHEENRFSVKEESSAGNNVMELIPDGEFRTVLGSDKKPVEVKCYFEKGSVVVVTRLESCRRTVVDSRTLALPDQDLIRTVTEVFPLDADLSTSKAILTMKRFLKRVSGSSSRGSASAQAADRTQAQEEKEKAPEPEKTFTSLSGVWVVIPEASDSLDPFLKEIGVAWVVRKLAASVQVTTTLLHTPDKFSVHDKSSAGETLVELTPDGEYREVTNSENKTSRMKCTQGDGEVVVTTHLPDCRRVVVDTRRLIQPDQLEQIAKVYVEGDNLKGAEPRVTMTRRLRKIAEAAPVEPVEIAQPMQTSESDDPDLPSLWPNLSGVWKPVKGECDDISELLVRMGVPWLARRIAVGLEVQTIITQTEDTFITVESSSVGSFTKRLHTDGIFHPVEQWKNGIRPQSCIADPHKGLVCSWISFGSGQLVEVRRMLSRTRMEMTQTWVDGKGPNLVKRSVFQKVETDHESRIGEEKELQLRRKRERERRLKMKEDKKPAPTQKSGSTSNLQNRMFIVVLCLVLLVLWTIIVNK